MTHDSAFRTVVRSSLLLMALTVFCPGWGALYAQTATNAANSALGGGGTAWVGGYDANFINPANIFLSAGRSAGRGTDGEAVTVDVGLAGFAAYAEPVWTGPGLAGFAEYMERTLGRYSSGSLVLDNRIRQEILSTHYPGQQNRLQNMFRSELLLMGFSRHSGGSAFSLSLRARQGMRTVTGRGWYSSRFTGETRDFTLLKQKQTLYELSAGFARELTLLDGLRPSVNRLVAGIAPKLVLGGAYMDVHYDARYRQNDAGAIQQPSATFDYAYRHHSAGSYSEMFQQYQSTGEVDATIDRTLPEYNSLRPTGYGVGIDMGLTYLIPLDHPLPAEEPVRPDRGNILQIGLSITDLGVIRYSRETMNAAVDPGSVAAPSQGIALSYFTGSEGQLLEFYEQMTGIPNPLHSIIPGSLDSEEFTTSLPTALNTGVMLRLGGIRLMGDLSLGLSDTPFNTKQLTAHLGMEVRPVPALPISAGTQLAAGRPAHWMLGTGVETGRFELLLSGRFLSRPGDLTPRFAGAGFGGVRLRF